MANILKTNTSFLKWQFKIREKSCTVFSISNSVSISIPCPFHNIRRFGTLSLRLTKTISARWCRCSKSFSNNIKPWRACAARVTVVVLCVCTVCLYVL